MSLTESQRDHLSARLHAEREEVVQMLARYDEALRETDQDASGNLSKVPLHSADEGSDTLEQELRAQESSRLAGALQEIDEALDRLQRDPETFGRDERTGGMIPFERLEMIPWARTGVDVPGAAEQAEPTIEDVPAASRYEARVAGRSDPATAEYRRQGQTIVFTHTLVPKSMEGQGVGSALARFVLDDARRAGLAVLPECPFIATFIRRHGEYLELVPEDAREKYELV
jgi:predicted GNAT family acetyltransferase